MSDLRSNWTVCNNTVVWLQNRCCGVNVRVIRDTPLALGAYYNLIFCLFFAVCIAVVLTLLSGLVRYKLVAQKDSFLTPMELNYLFESFDAIDRLTSSEIRLRRCLQRKTYSFGGRTFIQMLCAILDSLTAYHIQDPLERALAFGALILDVNDDALFLTASSETASERQKNADDQTNRALSLTLMDNRRDLYHQPPVTDSAISFNTPSQLIDVTENRAPEKAYDDTWDANSYSVSFFLILFFALFTFNDV